MRSSLFIIILLLAAATASSARAFFIVPSGTPPASGPPQTAFFVATGGSDANPGTLLAPFLTLARCQTAMEQSAIAKTCYVRGGVYSLSASISLTSADAGETWSYYPPDGVGSPALTQTSAFAYFLLNDGANNPTITGFSATGFQHIATTSCGNVPQASFIWGPTTVSGATANVIATHNILTNFDCGIVLANATNPIVSYNFASVVEYVAFGCGGCTGAATQSVWQGNIIYDVDPDQQGPNGYGIVFSPNYDTNFVSSNFTVRGNYAYNSANWVCYNNHAGKSIWWIDNLCVRSRGDAGGYSETALSASLLLNNGIQANNIWDEGVETSAIDTYVMCGYVLPCSSTTTGITGGQIANNFVLNNLNACVLQYSPTVTVNMPNNPYCNTLPPETVSSIDFGNFSTYGFAANQPNAVVATLVPHMSAAYWDFPVPPGSFSVAGTNSGGFVVCNQVQLCQPAGGTPAGTYSDFAITATLHGMAGSPVTVAAGTLTLTTNAFFVATTGSDGNAGTFASPFATLAKCQAAMEAGPGKTCFIRSGTYTPAPSSASQIGCNNGSIPANLVQLTHAKGDDGEVWSAYPPDGTSPIFDGSSTIPTAFCAYHVKNVTVTGLTFQHFQQSPLFAANWDADDGNGTGDTFSNDIVLNSVPAGGNPGITAAGWVEHAGILNNAVVTVGGQGIGASTTQASAVGGLAGLTVKGNAILGSCTQFADCGAVYLQDYQSPRSTSILIQNNYAYQINAASTGGSGLYLDDGASNVILAGNVVVAGGNLSRCFLIHGGANDVFRDNVCDEGAGTDIVFYQQSVTAPGPMTGNALRGNTIVCSASVTCGNGYVGSLSPPAAADTNSNIVWNYGSVSTVTTSGSGGANGDANPINIIPGLTCWDLGRHFGPPGFQIPQGGTPSPSWPAACPTTSGVPPSDFSFDFSGDFGG